MMSRFFIVWMCFLSLLNDAKAQSYPKNYFRSPLDIPMSLVANFGEIRTNHWHMGLDIRTEHRVNLPVHAAADGYIARVTVEPGGFGQAIYINHPNGMTTVYGHLNAFFPPLAHYVKEHQYATTSWNIDLPIPPSLFPVKKGDFIALSGSTGASEGPHVHFEIRDTKTDKCLNPLLFGFPIADEVPPAIVRLALYDRNQSTYLQSPQLFPLKKSGASYSLAGTNTIRSGSDKISFAIGTYDCFSHSTNPNGTYSAEVMLDDKPISAFALNNIDYADTRYINAQLDYRYKHNGGSNLQHITPLPGENSGVYTLYNDDGCIHLNDENPHTVTIAVKDAYQNTSRLQFSVQYDPALAKDPPAEDKELLLPGNVNVIEKDGFELFTTERTIYDTVPVSFSSASNNAANAVSPLFTFLNASIPAHDSVTVRIVPSSDITPESNDHIIIKNVSGTKTFVQKAIWQKNFLMARFRQFGTYQAFIDTESPTINAPGPGGDLINLSGRSHILFIPHDNFEAIKSFRAELDGQWLLFTNDKGHAWVYTFDEHFPEGEHELKVTVEDEAGNVLVKTWKVKR